MSDNIIYKTCSKCKLSKPTHEFYRQNAKYLRSYCKVCNTKMCRDYKRKGKTEPFRIYRERGSIDFKIESKIFGTRPYFSQKWKSLYQSAKRRDIEFKLKVSDVAIIYADFDKPCPYCKQPIEKASVDRKDNEIGYLPENCILICSLCNSMKVNISKLQIQNIYLHLFGDIKPSDVK